MARISPAPEKQAEPSFTGESWTNDLSKDVIIFVGAIKEDMKGVDLAKTEESAGRSGGTSKICIYQVPNHWKHKELFRPQIVSIGPYARGNDGRCHLDAELADMEVVKKQFLHDLVKKTSDADAFLIACAEMLREMEPAIRSCYNKSFHGMQSDAFIKIMLLDGIFIIQYFMKWRRHDIFSATGYVQWNFSMIMHDLLLLENQIPFFVLQGLFDIFVCHTKCTCNNSGDTDCYSDLELLDEILGGFKSQGELSEINGAREKVPDIDHLLHLYHRWYTSKKYRRAPMSNARTDSCIRCVKHYECVAPASILSATKLQESGVKFKKKKRSTSFLDVTFRNGNLEIPPFSVDDMMTSKFANLIALEQSSKSNDVPRVITSYVAFMDRIIDTPGDVEILRHERILENMLASKEEVAFFSNQLCRYSHLDTDHHYLAQVFKDVDAYSKRRWHREMALLVRNHCSNTWVFISLVAAVILLVLAFLQAYFAVYAYFHPP